MIFEHNKSCLEFLPWPRIQNESILSAQNFTTVQQCGMLVKKMEHASCENFKKFEVIHNNRMIVNSVSNKVERNHLSLYAVDSF